jgi:hypothetical protein
MTGVTIKEEILSDNSRLYTIVDGSSCKFASFNWYLLSGTTVTLVSTDSTYLLKAVDVSAHIGDKLRVMVNQYSETYWNGGEFYGGNFSGNFGGGTFHYGQLNECFYIKQEIKPKPFIEYINKPTGPQSIKSVNSSSLL